MVSGNVSLNMTVGDDYDLLPKVPNLFDYSTPGEAVAGELGPTALTPFLPVVSRSLSLMFTRSTSTDVVVEGEAAASKAKWVDENAGMSQTARDYNDSATGARSNPLTQKVQAPGLERTMEDGSTRLVKFDGIDGDVLVDRKISVVTTDKAKDQALRQSEALSQNGLSGRWEVPTEAQAARANKMFKDLSISNIQVKVVKP